MGHAPEPVLTYPAAVDLPPRLDDDLDESTMDALRPLYPRLSPGGFLIVDDYEPPMCRKAIHDFRDRERTSDETVEIDQAAIYWRRPPTEQSGAASMRRCSRSSMTRRSAG